ncbi:velvet protein [Arachnomyces sp. PD_36]|nr:velvet protein [Arachnomyces sp. PD_36]
MENPLHPRNETEHSFTRITKEGKTLTYNLQVIQQPERARACGAGAKSSADRRPVDPPPVVELRIFETDPNDGHKTDITFGYNANFFLYATLATARPMAHGRVQGQPPSCPALTGVPVAGIAYLDRPVQAGYFIFPDLSVRHEGRYRLSFNLYEQVKEDKDADKDSLLPVQDNVPSTPSKPSAPRAHLHFRLEVKSVPFTVFSAKKFPGLAESTPLSRMVAEQGCRVRIRRDVRMRRREAKTNKEFHDYEDNPSYVRPDRYITPETYSAPPPVERPRSTSNSTVVDPAYNYQEPQRRPSNPDYGYHPQPYPQPPVTPTGGYQSHLAFGSAAPQYQAPPLPSAQHPPPPPPTAPYSSPHPAYSHVHSRHGSASSDYDPNMQKYPQPHYPPPVRHQQVDRSDYSKSNPPPPPLDPPRSHSVHTSDPRAHQSAGPIPISSPRSRTPSTSSYPPLAPAQSISTEIQARHQHHQSISGAIPAEPLHPKGRMYTTEQILASKRSHGTVFGSAHQDKPLHHGMRPDSSPVHHPAPHPHTGPCASDLVPDDNADRDGYPNSYSDRELEAENMEYRRANGEKAHRRGLMG